MRKSILYKPKPKFKIGDLVILQKEIISYSPKLPFRIVGMAWLPTLKEWCYHYEKTSTYGYLANQIEKHTTIFDLIREKYLCGSK